MSADSNRALLPPLMRRVALALSCGVIALLIWDRLAPPQVADLHPPSLAKVTSAKNAPVAQLDVSREAAGVPDAAHAQAPVSGPLAVSRPARAAGNPLADDASVPAAAPPEAAPTTMSEQERSARNEELFTDLERQKKRLGIVKVLSKAGDAASTRGGGVSEMGRLPGPVEPPALGDSLTPTLIEAPARRPGATAKTEALPAGMVLRDAPALARAWSGAGLAGKPPEVDFTAQMALFLSLPGAIEAVESGPESVKVLYRFSPDAAPQARLKAAPVSPLPVLFLPRP